MSWPLPGLCRMASLETALCSAEIGLLVGPLTQHPSSLHSQQSILLEFVEQLGQLTSAPIVSTKQPFLQLQIPGASISMVLAGSGDSAGAADPGDSAGADSAGVADPGDSAGVDSAGVADPGESAGVDSAGAVASDESAGAADLGNSALKLPSRSVFVELPALCRGLRTDN